jgi:hypothetical protein
MRCIDALIATMVAVAGDMEISDPPKGVEE